jgi:hypothetical protein
VCLSQVHEWLAAHLPAGARVGIDPAVHTIEAAEKLRRKLAAAGKKLVPLEANPVDAVWADRPAPPQVGRSGGYADVMHAELRACRFCWVVSVAAPACLPTATLGLCGTQLLTDRGACPLHHAAPPHLSPPPPPLSPPRRPIPAGPPEGPRHGVGGAERGRQAGGAAAGAGV